MKVKCKMCVRVKMFERVVWLGCGVRDDVLVMLVTTRAFYAIAKKGSGATSDEYVML